MVLLSFIIVNLVFALIILLFNKLTCGYCKCHKHLVGKVVIVTGGNGGIGYETAKDLAERGARVILACRNENRGIAARNSIVNSTGNVNVCFRSLDLSSLNSVKAFAEDILKNEERLDILINNAAIYGSENVKTKDGLLLGMQTNYFGPFLLTNLLLPLLKTSAPSRIINVASSAHVNAKLDLDNLNMEKETEQSYNPHEVYRLSKLCNVLMTTGLAEQLKGTGVTANSLHPGAVYTDIWKEVPLLKHLIPIIKLFLKSPWEGAQTSIYLAVSPEVLDVSGYYYSDCHQKPSSPQAQDMELVHKLWEISVELVKLK